MPVGRNGWSGGEGCSGAPIAEPVPRRRVSANLENASRIRAFGYVRFFGHDGAVVPRPWRVPPPIRSAVRTCAPQKVDPAVRDLLFLRITGRPELAGLGWKPMRN